MSASLTVTIFLNAILSVLLAVVLLGHLVDHDAPLDVHIQQFHKLPLHDTTIRLQSFERAA